MSRVLRQRGVFFEFLRKVRASLDEPTKVQGSKPSMGRRPRFFFLNRNLFAEELRVVGLPVSSLQSRVDFGRWGRLSGRSGPSANKGTGALRVTFRRVFSGGDEGRGS